MAGLGSSLDQGSDVASSCPPVLRARPSARPLPRNMPDNEHRATGGVCNGSRYRAPEKIKDPALAAGADHNQVGFIQVRASHNGRGNRGCTMGLATHTLQSRLPRSTKCFVEIAPDVVVRPQIGWDSAQARRDRRIDHVEHKPRRQLAGQTDRKISRILGRLRVIDGTEDLGHHSAS
jgi:hypothetical protein